MGCPQFDVLKAMKLGLSPCFRPFLLLFILSVNRSYNISCVVSTKLGIIPGFDLVV